MVEIVLAIVAILMAPVSVSVGWAVKQIINHRGDILVLKRESELRAEAAKENNEKVEKSFEVLLEALADIRKEIKVVLEAIKEGDAKTVARIHKMRDTEIDPLRKDVQRLQAGKRHLRD